MCNRTCPRCRSTDHMHLIGIIGSYLMCDKCSMVLAARADIAAAPIRMTEAEAENWQRAESGVIAGAEADDPADDEMFGPNRWPMEADDRPEGAQ